MTLHERIDAFAELGYFFRRIGNMAGKQTGPAHEEKEFIASLDAIRKVNPWFDRENVLFAFQALGKVMEKPDLEKWTGQYPELKTSDRGKTIGVVMAGNIPLVGFHDFMSVLITGNRFSGKTSSRDGGLHRAVAGKLISIEPQFGNLISFTGNKLSGIDAIIATGSDNTARHFSWTYRNIPSLIRKNMNGVAILDGSESPEQLNGLANDIFRYYGLGCRSVSKIFVPDNYDFTPLLDVFNNYGSLSRHREYRNNLLYHRANLTLEEKPFIEGPNILLTEDAGTASPVGVLYYQTYRNRETIMTCLKEFKDQIQCVVAGPDKWPGTVPFGQSQFPALSDYADRKDTLRFLLKVSHNN